MAKRKPPKLKVAEVKPARDHKDRVFRLIFKDKQKLLELYNAINGTAYQNPEDLTITTLENAIYMNMRNDVSFVLHDELTLYEHQSSDNPNMPLRNLFYVCDVYSGLIYKDDLHQISQIKIPEPKFLVFYNGIEERPERWEQRLSEAYCNETDEPALELRTTILNINLGKNQELAEKCRPLLDYIKLVDKIRKYTKLYPANLKKAMEAAVDECIREDIMADFLRKNRAEVIKMSIYEYDAERVRKLDREYGMKQGLEKGLKQGLEQGLEQGRRERLVKQVCKDLKKGNNPFDMEEDAEEIEQIKQIVQIARTMPEEYSWKDVYQEWQKQLSTIHNQTTLSPF